MITNQKIGRMIDDYINRGGASNVLKRAWRGKYIRGHAPWNNEEDCYHNWLTIVNDNIESLDSIATFDELYKAVEKLKIKGIGDLTIYDTATLIGCPRKIYPTKVYLHAGAAAGARALGIDAAVVERSLFVSLFPAFDKLNALQIEDFLCIYKSHLQGIVDETIKPEFCCLLIEDVIGK